MKRPLLAVALLYMGGIALADLVRLPVFWLLSVTLALALAALGWSRRRSFLLAPLIVLTGAANFTQDTAVLSPRDLRRLVENQAQEVAVRGALRGSPYQRVYDHEDEASLRTLAVVEVEGLRRPGREWEPAYGRVAVSTPGALPEQFFSGQRVEVVGELRPPESPVAKGLFDYRKYLARLGIYHQLPTRSTNDWRLLSSSGPLPLAERFNQWAKAVLARDLPEEDEPLRLLWAMTLGWKTALTGEVSEPFMRSGTMHIFAISGLHIALIAGILVALLRVLRLPRRACGVVVIPLLWFYTYATGLQASAIRSSLMMSVIIGGWSLHRPSDLLNSLAAAACLILVWDPQQLFQAGFQLSFSVVLSLALFGPVFQRLRESWLQPDPLVPAALRPRWQRWSFKALHGVAASFATSLAAWLGSIPLIAWYFHLFTPVSLPANLIVVPLSSAALASSLASLLVGGWFEALGSLLNHSAWFWMLLMIRVSEWAADLPGAYFYVSAPGPLALGWYYVALISVMAGWLVRPRIRLWAWTSLFLLSGLCLAQWSADRGKPGLTLLPLRGGHALYLNAAQRGGDWLIDCGNASSAEFVTKPFLHAQGVNRLPHLLFTHGDQRHVGGAEVIFESFPIGRVYLGETRFRSPAYRQLRERCQGMPEKVRFIRRGERIGPWNVLHPSGDDRFPQADDASLVLLGEFCGARVLLLSDLGKPGQNTLVNREPALRADIIVSGLPATSEPLADALLEMIRPDLIVIADAEYPNTERARPRLRERLAAHRAPVLYTSETGALTLSFAADGWEVRGARGLRASGQRHAGSSQTPP